MWIAKNESKGERYSSAAGVDGRHLELEGGWRVGVVDRQMQHERNDAFYGINLRKCTKGAKRYGNEEKITQSFPSSRKK